MFGHLLANWEITCGEEGIVDAVQNLRKDLRPVLKKIFSGNREEKKNPTVEQSKEI